jgi:hypothetical protein
MSLIRPAGDAPVALVWQILGSHLGGFRLTECERASRHPVVDLSFAPRRPLSGKPYRTRKLACFDHAPELHPAQANAALPQVLERKEARGALFGRDVCCHFLLHGLVNRTPRKLPSHPERRARPPGKLLGLRASCRPRPRSPVPLPTSSARLADPTPSENARPAPVAALPCGSAAGGSLGGVRSASAPEADCPGRTGGGGGPLNWSDPVGRDRAVPNGLLI